MTEPIRTGVIFEGEDNLSSTLDRIADNTERSGRRQEEALEDVEEQADDTGTSLESMATITTGVASAMEIAKAGAEILVEGLRMVTEAAINQRTEGDAQLKTWNEMTDTFEDFGALLGDVVVPVVLGLYRAFEPVISAAGEFLGTNRELMATNIGGFLQGLAEVLINGVAIGLKIVIGAWAGLRSAVALVTAAVSQYVGTVTEGFSVVLGSIKAAAEAMGMDGLAGQIGGAEETLRGFSNASKAIAEEAVRDVGAIWDGYNEVSEAIDGAVIPALEAAGNVQREVSRQAQQEILKESAAERRRREEAEAASEAIIAARQAETEARQQATEQETEGREVYFAAVRDMQEAQAQREREMAEARQARLEESMGQAEAVASQASDVGASFGDVFASIASGARDSSQAIADLMRSIASTVIDTIKKVVMGYAVQAAATAFATHVGVGPFVGLAIGAAAAGTAFGIVEGLLGQLPAFATGGWIPGGGASQDSVLMRGMPRERVMSHAEIFRAGSVLDRVLGGQLEVPAGGGAGRAPVNISFQSVYPFTSHTQFDLVTEQHIRPSLRRVEELS